MPALADRTRQSPWALTRELTLIRVKWTISGGAGAVGVTTGSDPGVTVTRTGVGAYRVDYPAGRDAIGVFNSNTGTCNSTHGAADGQYVVTTGGVDLANGSVIQGHIWARAGIAP